MSPSDKTIMVGDWIVNWLQGHRQNLIWNGSVSLNIDYLESGLIDSVSMIEFIIEIEAEFGIRIGSGNMADPRFSTISGLVDIINELRGG